ncbi:MAG: hypothetical protein ACREJC_19715 [Tepidisphaeraceae bacterium]
MPRAKKSKAFSVTRFRTPAQVAALRRAALHALAAIALIASAFAGVWVLRRHVDKDVVYLNAAPRIVLKDRPIWMSDYLAEQIVASAQPLGAHSAFDHQLLVTVNDAIRFNPWVRKVRQIRRAYSKAPGDTIEVDCEFRTPLALVHWQDYYWLVDGEGVKLPEQFTAAQLPRIVNGRDNRLNIRIIEGVRQAPVESGARWPGDDLAAGLELARYLHGQKFAEEIVCINVANFAGRQSLKDAQLTLITKRRSEIRWGRPVSAKDFFVEISTAQKLELLARVFAQYGRVDAGQPWIDIRFDKITYPSGAPQANADAGR